jgi:hypothetical protein
MVWHPRGRALQRVEESRFQSDTLLTPCIAYTLLAPFVGCPEYAD